MEQNVTGKSDLLSMTVEVVTAYVSGNSVRTEDLPDLITSVHFALSGLGAPPSEPEAAKAVPEVPVKKSVTPDAIISLIDGKPYKTLGRHLTANGLTPDEYRVRYGLPRTYPMVAASYSARRSEIAKALGLGRKREPSPVEPPEPIRRGRKKAL